MSVLLSRAYTVWKTFCDDVDILYLHCSIEVCVIMEMFYICYIHYDSLQLHVVIEHLKHVSCDWKTEFLKLINLI